MIPRFGCFARTAHFYVFFFSYLRVKKHVVSSPPPWKRTWHAYARAFPFRGFLHPYIFAAFLHDDDDDDDDHDDDDGDDDDDDDVGKYAYETLVLLLSYVKMHAKCAFYGPGSAAQANMHIKRLCCDFLT